MGLGLPSITIAFKSTAITAIQRSQRGIVAMILREDDPTTFKSPYTIYTSTDVPTTLSAENQEQIGLALMGYQTPPSKVLVYIEATAATTYNDVLLQLENARWDYLVIPDIATADVITIETWIKTMRSTKDKMVKAVLPNASADSEGIINFTNTSITTAAKTYTTAQYCSRIAGMIAGTPLTISCTFAPLSEVIACDLYTKEQMDTKIGAGELFVMFDGSKFKIARGVNSLQTTTQDKSDSFKKIKLIDAMDLIHDDIKTTANDSYIGKYSNSYDHKCLLLSAIQGYFDQLELDGILDPKKNTVAIDTAQQRVYLLSNGDYTQAKLATMKDQDVNAANTRDQVFLAAAIKILDAIEQIKLGISI